MLRNGLDYSLYQFSEENRNALRKELGIENSFVVGHVGRFSQQKNHEFLVDIFKCISDKNPNAVLLLAGIGELENAIHKKVNHLGLKNKVIFLGRRDDVPRLLSAFDVLLFPSFHEGMPNVVIEAQASGLPCIIADTITSQADITGLVHYLPLSLSADTWADEVLLKSDFPRENTKEKFYNAGYDQDSVVKEFIRLVFENKSTKT